MKNSRYFYMLLLFSASLLSPFQGFAQEDGSGNDARTRTRSRIKRLELRGDRAFINGNYDQAVSCYETLSGRLEKRNLSEWIRMRLKLARVYNMLQDYENAVLHYRSFLERQQEEVLDVDDVCNYINALLCLGKTQEAEIVARHFAYKSQYSRDQRYVNMLGSVSNIHHYYGIEDSDFLTERIPANTADAEYWIHGWDESIFCAVSGSRLMDPRKIYFHRTRYADISGVETQEKFRYMPRDVQNGPATNYGDVWIVTRINYRGASRISGIDVKEAFRAQLYYTIYDKKRSRWTAPVPVFENQGDVNYAHPVLLDEGRTLLFSSDMKGGYGGMDLYISRWDESEGKWSAPVNLGSSVNTEGDEIYPNVADGILYFSSNGHEGYGGYDIYSVSFADLKVFPASLYHYPYPVNTVYNDYGLYQDGITAYFISDRGGLEFRDDIYTFRNARTSLFSHEPTGMSQEYLALNGNLTQTDLSSKIPSRKRHIDPVETRLNMSLREGDVLYTIYYDFDRWRVPNRAIAGLDSLIRDKGMETIDELLVIGYADEIGSDAYNAWLSTCRAEAVADYLDANGIRPKVTWEGRGRIAPDSEDYNRQLSQIVRYDFTVNPEVRSPLNEELSMEDRIRLNRTARRVDIVVRKK